MANNRGLWQGAERATANLANTGMRLLEYQSRREDRAETLDLTKRGLELRQKQFASDEERNRLLNRKTQMDIAAQEKKEELTTFEEIFQKMGVTDKRVQDYILKYAGPYVETGPVSGKPSIQKQYGREFYNKLNADDNAVLGIVTLRGRGIKEEIASIDEQLGARIMMPRKKEELLKQKVSLEAQLAAADNVAKKLMGRKAEKTTPNITGVDPITGKPVRTPDVPGAEVYQKPEPSKETPEQRRAADLQIKKDFAIWKEKFEKELPDKPREGLNANQQRVLDQSLASAGSTILNNAESEAVKPHIDFVNKYLSSENHIFAWVKEKGFWGEKGKAIRVELPGGVTAEDVKFTAEKNKKTINDILRAKGYIK